MVEEPSLPVSEVSARASSDRPLSSSYTYSQHATHSVSEQHYIAPYLLRSPHRWYSPSCYQGCSPHLSCTHEEQVRRRRWMACSVAWRDQAGGGVKIMHDLFCSTIADSPATWSDSFFARQPNLSTASELGNVGGSSRYWQSSISQLDKVLLHMACNLVQGRDAHRGQSSISSLATPCSTCCVVLVPRALAIFSNLLLSIASGG